MKKIFFSLSISLLVITGSVNSQNCLDYGEFDGPDCVCAPPGWTGVTGAEEIDDMSVWGGTCNIPGPSPQGGSAVALNVNAGIGEAIETTVDGLIPGQYYELSFWWLTMSCPGFCCSDLEVVVDGESYLYEDAETWELVELCVLAESESIDLELNSVFDGSFTIFIDDTGCMPLSEPCCPLILDIEESFEVCPNEVIALDGFYDNEIGDVTVTWTSDPADGIDYLSDISIVDPEFEFVYSDIEFEGITYEFTLVVEDDDCMQTKELEIEVLPLVIPTFNFEDFEVCESEESFIFPTVSLEGISGTWQQAEVDIEGMGNQTVTNFFLPDYGQVDCPQESMYELKIEELVIPTFEFPLYFCRSQVDVFEFPTTSIEDVDGEWSPESFITEDWADGIVVATFTPDDLFCTESVDVEIELDTGDELEFNLQTVYCDDIEFFVFPSEDEDGIMGYWDEPIIDFTNLNGLYYNVFHSVDMDCYEDYIFDFEVASQVTLTFDTISPICRMNGEIVLDSFSQQGFQGYWTLEKFNPDTIVADIVASTWIPLPGQSDCIEDSTFIFSIINAETPEFDLPSKLCYNDEEFILPTLSDNSLTGSWTLPSFIPSSVGSSIVTSMFIPDSDCTNTFEAVFEIEPLIDIEFELEDVYCENESSFTLPIISDNGVEGMWLMPTINPSSFGGQLITNVFTANDQSDCFEDFILTIEIEESTVPLFSLPEYFCVNTQDFILPVISENGISGTWNIPVINTELIIDSLTVNLIFTPNDTNCNAILDVDIDVSQDFSVEENIFQPTGCSISDGIIQLSSLENLEYSINGGLTWSPSGSFENLEAGLYIISVRKESYPDCIKEVSISLQSPNGPEIIDIITRPVIPCSNENGSIEIVASGNDLEYSIDGGLTWRVDSFFEILLAGNYDIVVREQAAVDCIIEQQVVVEEFTAPLITELVITELSTCEASDGIIVIEAEGQDLEFSIDGGSTWSANNSFENLPSGVYNIIVRPEGKPDCIDTLEGEILEVGVPTISMVDIYHSNSCEPTRGMITLIVEEPNVEYSFDDGLTWGLNNTFTDLVMGHYKVLIRFIDFPECINEEPFYIEEDDVSLSVPEIEVVGVSDCYNEDGIINIVTSDEYVEFSINGIDWQDDGHFSGLSPGMYVASVRRIIWPSCTMESEVVIDSVLCCNDLDISFEMDATSCLDESSGSIEITEVTGMQNEMFEIEWNNGSDLLAIENLGSDWYYFVISYDEDCQWEDSIFVEKIEAHSFELVSIDENCQGENNGTIEVVDLLDGLPPFTFSLDGTNYQSEGLFNFLSPGDYDVFVKDSNGCVLFKETSIGEAPFLSIELPSIISIPLGDSITLDPVINESLVNSFVWTPSTGINSILDLMPIVSPDVTTEYTITVNYGDGCILQHSVIVEVVEDDDVYIPNAFSPTSGDVNSTFKPFITSNSNIIFNSLKVFDRWGNLMLDKSNEGLSNDDIFWDGRYGNELLNPGVYVYLLVYSKGEKSYTQSGSITLIK